MEESEQPSAGGDVDREVVDREVVDREVMDREVVRAQYVWAATSPSAAVVETVASATDRSSTEIEPLYDYVDPGALDAIMQSGDAADGRGLTTVVFTYDGRRITVYSDGEVVVDAVPGPIR